MHITTTGRGALAIEQRPETEFYLSILYSLKGKQRRAQLIAALAEEDLGKKEHDQRIRPVWKTLIHAGIPIIDGKKDEALSLIQTLTTYITTQRIYEALKGHLQFLLEGTDHKDWLPEFMEILKLKKE